MSDAKDIGDIVREGGQGHDPQKRVKPANEKAKLLPIRRELKAVSLADGFGRIIENAQAGKPAMGMKLGHYQLDRRMCGLRRQMVLALGARTSVGKTSKALQVCDLNMRDNAILYISCEDGEGLSLKRLMARRANVNALRLRDNTCTEKEMIAMKRELSLAPRTPFFLDAVGVPVEDICVFIRNHCKEHNTALVVFDYLQKAKSKMRSQDRRILIGDMAQLLSDTIKEGNAAGLLLSQIARPDKNKPNEPPGLYDFKEAGEIENAAEHCLLGWVEETPADSGNPKSKAKIRTRKWRLLKNKDGPLFDETFEEQFDEYTASFKETYARTEDQDIDNRYDSAQGELL